MSDSRTRSGARLHVESRRFAGLRHAATDADYASTRCLYCGVRLNVIGRANKFCSDNHRVSYFHNNKCARGTLPKKAEGRWRFAYDQARAAIGEWITVQCESRHDAGSLETIANNKKGFDAVRNGASVSLRFMGFA